MKAPIALFTYNRLNHTKKTIHALLNNEGASDSNLYIFSDAWKLEKDKENVLAVREFIKGIVGFKSIKVVEASTNKGLAQSIIEGVSMVLKDYPNIIVLEDDLETSPLFLNFMNDALAYYSPSQIWSIAGYSPSIEIPSEYPFQTYLTNRNCSWGWATWSQNWLKTDWEINDYKLFIKNKEEIEKYNTGGNDLTPMLLKQQLGQINSWSIRFNYSGFKANLPTVYPIQSLVNNIGTDGSGTHLGQTNKYKVSITDTKLERDKFCPPTHYNKSIIKNFSKFYDTSIYRSIINWWKIKRANNQ